MLDRGRAPAESGDEVRPVAFRGGGFSPKAGRYSGWIALLLAIGIWQLTGSVGLVNPLFLPTPVAIARAIYQLALSGALWHHVSWSIMRMLARMASMTNSLFLGNKAKVPGIFIPARLHARCKPLRYTNARAKAVLGWTPRYGLIEALDRSVGAAT